MQFTTLSTLAFSDVPKPAMGSANTLFSMQQQAANACWRRHCRCLAAPDLARCTRAAFRRWRIFRSRLSSSRCLPPSRWSISSGCRRMRARGCDRSGGGTQIKRRDVCRTRRMADPRTGHKMPRFAAKEESPWLCCSTCFGSCSAASGWRSAGRLPPASWPSRSSGCRGPRRASRSPPIRCCRSARRRSRAMNISAVRGYGYRSVRLSWQYHLVLCWLAGRLALGHLVTAVLLCHYDYRHFLSPGRILKLAGIALWPIGKVIVSGLNETALEKSEKVMANKIDDMKARLAAFERRARQAGQCDRGDDRQAWPNCCQPNNAR